MPSESKTLSGTSPVALAIGFTPVYTEVRFITKSSDDTVRIGDSATKQLRLVLPGQEFAIDPGEYGGSIDLSHYYAHCETSGGTAELTWYYPD